MRRITSLLAGLLVASAASVAIADDPKTILIGKPVAASKVPPLLAQGKFLSLQAVSAVDVSGDGQRIAVATMAFRHEPNFWTFSGDGKLLWSRNVAPWAPYQVALTGKGGSAAVSLAYSRITPPYPTVSVFQDEKGTETALTDNAGERGWFRYGSGDWRTGWLVSALGDQVVRAGDTVLTIPTNNGALQLSDDGSTRKLPGTFATHRPYRLAASGDGRVVASGYLVPDVSKLDKGTVPESLRAHSPSVLVSVRDSTDGKEFCAFKPTAEAAGIAPLPEPVKDFPELAENFALRPDAVLPFRVAASVAVNADGSRIAVTEYAGWLWVRAKPAIGSWDPPYHVIPFIPRQRGVLRVFDGSGAEFAPLPLPTEGLFDVRLDSDGNWGCCAPLSWFARGMAGSAWLPTDSDARRIYRFTISPKPGWTLAVQLPDAVSDMVLTPHPAGDRLLVSCWDGKLYTLDKNGQLQGSLDVHGPARLQWSHKGHYAVAGTADGEVVCLDADGKQRWRTKLTHVEVPPLAKPIERVFAEVPIYQVSRVGAEHAYVGDTWLIKTERGGVLVDAGGTSGIPLTLQRIESAGVDVKNVKFLLHSHSHGDHCGAGYLWRAMGLQIVAPASADFTLAWLMPMLTDYGVWVPRPVDRPLPLKRAGDEAEITLEGLKIKAIFVPGHSFDSVIYVMDLDGKRVVFTGDIGFDQQDILHRCWGDTAKARAVTETVRKKVLPLKPDFVFRGHGAKRDGTVWVEDLVKRTDEAIRKAEGEKK
jgi:glyoxylase-like metal-dependent hydrolase (beta-lactamase superfamily II)